MGILDGRSSYFPISPTNKQIWTDAFGIRWRYFVDGNYWERIGASQQVDLASDTTTGLLSYTDKKLLDNTPAVGGGFGLVVDPKLVNKNPTNPDGVITGDIVLKSDSLEILCGNVATGEELSCIDTTIICNDNDPSALAGLIFKLNDVFLRTMVVARPGAPGPKGATGDKGDDGEPGWSDGPSGIDGKPGDDIEELCELTGLSFTDDDTLTDTPIVSMRLVDEGNGPILIVEKAKLQIGTDTASRISAQTLTRSLSYPDDSDPSTCAVTRLNNWSLEKPTDDTTQLDLQILRLPKNYTDGAAGFNAVSLSTVVGGIVDIYVQRLTDLDKQWGKEVKEYIENIDNTARGILSELADQLTQCEFDLPATDFAISLENCGTPITPSIAAGSTAKSIHRTIGKSGQAASVGLGLRTWRSK